MSHVHVQPLRNLNKLQDWQIRYLPVGSEMLALSTDWHCQLVSQAARAGLQPKIRRKQRIRVACQRSGTSSSKGMYSESFKPSNIFYASIIALECPMAFAGLDSGQTGVWWRTPSDDNRNRLPKLPLHDLRRRHGWFPGTRWPRYVFRHALRAGMTSHLGMAILRHTSTWTHGCSWTAG